MKKLIILVAFATLTIFAVTLANAQGWGFMGPLCPRISNLTADQKLKIQELQRKFIEETAQIRGNIMTKRLELKSLWADPKTDPNAIRVKEKELRELQNQLIEKALENRLEIRKILTPEQIAEFGFTRGFGPEFGYHGALSYGKRGHGQPMRCW